MPLLTWIFVIIALFSTTLDVEVESKSFTYNGGIMISLMNRIDCDVGDGLEKINMLSMLYQTGTLVHDNSIQSAKQDERLVTTLFSFMPGMGSSLTWIGAGFENYANAWFYQEDSIFYSNVPSTLNGHAVSKYVTEYGEGSAGCVGGYKNTTWNVSHTCMYSGYVDATSGLTVSAFSGFFFNITGRKWYQRAKKTPTRFSAPYTYGTATVDPVVVMAGCSALFDVNGTFIGAANFAMDVTMLSESLTEDTEEYDTLQLFYVFEVNDGALLACNKDGMVTNSSSNERFHAHSHHNHLIRSSHDFIMHRKNNTHSFRNITGMSLLDLGEHKFYMNFEYMEGMDGYAFSSPWGIVVLEAVDCLEGYALENTTLTCQKCAYPTYSLGGVSSCSICDDGYYFDDDECIDCPSNTDCPTGTTLDTIVLNEGYWRWPDTTEILECLHPDACVGGNDSTSYCLPHHQGPYCEVCSTGYHRSAGTECESCGMTFEDYIKQYPWLIPLVAVVIIMANCIPVLALTLQALADEFNQVLSDMVDNKPHDIFKRLSNKLKIVFVCIQIVVNCVNSLAVEYPGEVSSLSKSMTSIMALMPTNFVPISCMAPDSAANAYWTELLTITLFPVGLTVIIFVYHGIRIKRSRYPDEVAEIKKTLVSNVVLLLFTILPSASTVVLNTFYVDYTDGDNLDRAYLYVDYSTNYHSKFYRHWMVPYALLFTFIYPIGIPLFFLVLLRSHLEEVDPVVERPLATDEFSAGYGVSSRGRQYVDDAHMLKAVDARDANKDISHLGFLINTYEPQFWYWEVVISMYRIAITNLHVITRDYAVIAVFVTAIGYWKLVSVYAPFTYDEDDFLADVCQGVVVATLLMGIMIDQFGCPVYFKYIFLLMLFVVIVYLITMVLVDTGEERRFIWDNRKELYNAVVNSPKVFVEKKKEERRLKSLGCDESDL